MKTCERCLYNNGTIAWSWRPTQVWCSLRERRTDRDGHCDKWREGPVWYKPWTWFA